MDQSPSSQYKILQKLGTGGMGTVYLAMDQHIKRMVAIKVLNTNIAHDSSAFKRFLREIEITAQLDHPNIIKIYHVQTEGEFPQLIMELIKGKSLMEYLEQANPSLTAKLELMQKVAMAVEYAHKKKIIHRDIKPSNIMVRTNGEPVLMDFGIAKVTKVEDKSLTRSGEIVGTLQYMSPEQATGARREVDHRTDIYSLGAVLYHILTGQMPITAPTFMDMLDKIVHTEPIPLRELNPEIPLEVENICRKAMAKGKEKRYQTAYTFATDIANFLKGKKTVASSFVQQQKWMHRGKKIGLASGIIAALAVIVGVVIQIVVPQIAQSRHEQELMQNISTCYQEAQILLQSSDIEKQQDAYQKLFYAWKLGKQENQTKAHIHFLQQLFPQLRDTAYHLAVYWWPQDQDKSIVYLANLQDILEGCQNSDDVEKAMAVGIHLAYLRKDTATYQNCLDNLLAMLQSKAKLANQYPEVMLLQAKIEYQNKNYRKVLECLQYLPQEKYQKESLYYQGVCQYHLKNFARAEELLFAAWQAKDSQITYSHFQYDLVLYLANSLAQQFTYQKIPIERYQPVLAMLEELGNKTYRMSPDQLQHYLEMQARYNIEILAQHPEQSPELAQQILDLANRRLQNDPLYAASYLQRGIAYRYLGQFALAWKDYDYSFQMDPQQMDVIKQMWGIFPYYMDVGDNYVERFNTMIFRWGIKTQVAASQVGQEDFIKLRQQYDEAAKQFTYTPFQQEQFNKFYQNLSKPWKDMQILAQSALVSMVPHEKTLAALDKAIQQPGVKEADILAAQQLQSLIKKQQIQEEQLHWCYFISRTSYHGLLPQQTLEYVQGQEPFFKFLRHGILEQPTALSPEMQNNWLLLQFLAARILAQLSSHSQEYGRGFLYQLVNDANQSLELRIIVAKALHDAGLTYQDYRFIEAYLKKTKSKQYGKFLDMQVASLLISGREYDHHLLEMLVNTTPYPVVPMLIYYQLPEAEHHFLQDKLEPLCQIALQSNDRETQMMAILNFTVVLRYRKENQQRQKILLDLPQILQACIDPSQHINIQKAALYILMSERYLINPECNKKLENLLHSSDNELKLCSVAVLSAFGHPHIMSMILSDQDTFQEQIAFLYGVGTGQNGEKYIGNLQQSILSALQFLMSSRSIEGRGTLYCMICYFLPGFQMNLEKAQKVLLENQIQFLAQQYLKEKNPLLAFWALAGLTGLETISKSNIQLTQAIRQDITMPLYLRKMATSFLLYAEIKQNHSSAAPILSSQQQMLEEIKSQIRKNTNDPDELWQAALLGYKQALRNNYSDYFSNCALTGTADIYSSWDYYVLRFQRNIMEPSMCLRFQQSLENIIAVLELFPNRNQKQQEEWVKAIYLLAVLHIHSNHLPAAQAVLEKANLYLTDIRLSALWIRIQPTDLAKIIQHWQNAGNLSAYEQAWLVRFQAQAACLQRDYQKSNDLFLEQYILAPSDPLSLPLMAENMLQQSNFKQAHSITNHAIYLGIQPSHAYWTKARICATQQDYEGTYAAIRRNISGLTTTHPIRPQDLAAPLFDGLDRNTLYYYLARAAKFRYAHTEVISWLELALQQQAPIPVKFQPNGSEDNAFVHLKNNPKFQKIWKQLEKITKEKPPNFKD